MQSLVGSTFCPQPSALLAHRRSGCRAPARRQLSCRSEAQKEQNLIGVHVNTFTGNWERADIEYTAKGAQKAGFDLIEVNVSEPEKVDAELTKSILSDHGLQASASLGLSRATDVSNPETAEAGKKLLTGAMKALSTFGGKFMMGVTYCAMDKYREPCSKEQYQTSVKSIKEMSKVASDLGLTFGLEVINRYESNILNTGHQALHMINDIGAPNVVVHLDTYHMNIEEASMSKAIRNCQAAGRLGYFHVGESHRGYMGSGSIDWPPVWAALVESGYTGPITFESFSSKVVSPTLSNTLCVWRNLWEDSDDLAAQSREFIQNGLVTARRMQKLTAGQVV